eukprot:gene49494-3549_t
MGDIAAELRGLWGRAAPDWHRLPIPIPARADSCPPRPHLFGAALVLWALHNDGALTAAEFADAKRAALAAAV